MAGGRVWRVICASLLFSSASLNAAIISGSISNWPESGPLTTIGDGTNHVTLWWSINNADRGWFYGSNSTGDSDVAFASGVSDVTQITNAGALTYTNINLPNPHCDPACSAHGVPGVGEFIVWKHTTTGHFGALRIDDIHPGATVDELDATWWFDTLATGDFTGATVPPPVPGVEVVSEVPAERASSSTTTTEILKQGLAQIAVSMSNRIGSVLSGKQHGPGFKSPLSGNLLLETGTGLSAGDAPGNFGAWVSYGRMDIRNNFVSTAFSADMDNVVTGVDYLTPNDLLIGVALSYEKQDVTTFFNIGSQKVHGYTVAPYLGYLFNDAISADLTLGYTSSNIKQTRTLAGVVISGKQDSRRLFAAGNLNGVTGFGNWIVSGNLGYLYAKDELQSFTESNGLLNPRSTVKLGQGRIGGELAYSLGEWEPYASVALVRDFVTTETKVGAGVPVPSDDRDEMQFGLGLRMFSKQGISGTAGWITTRGRDNVDSDVYSVTLRMDF